MSDFGFDYLSGTATISENAPENWINKIGLYEFYHNPNNPAWGRQLARVLFHESLHFWQFLSSGYIANLVTDEWRRLLVFEKDQVILPLTERLESYKIRHDDDPFSVQELVECWARYWDVHTRGPDYIIEDEKIIIDPKIVTRRIADGLPVYSGKAFDEVILKGEDCIQYAAPYRWALNQSKNDSKFTAILFPIITFMAFYGNSPIQFFCKAWEKAVNSNILRKMILLGSDDIHSSWLKVGLPLEEEVLEPTREELGLTEIKTGFQVIKEGPLSLHPIFKDVFEKFDIMCWRFKQMSEESLQKFGKTHQITLYYKLGAVNPLFFPFCLPGDPSYRSVLGADFEPPRIQFANIIYDSTKPFLENETYKQESDDLKTRIRRFRAAEKAFSVGLPLDAFE